MSEAFYRGGVLRTKERHRNSSSLDRRNPSMSPELRLRGAEVSVASCRAEGGYYATLEDPLPKQVREAVDRICASRTITEHEYEQDIDESPEYER